MTETANRLTARSRITMRWTTNPEDMGYGYKPAPRTLAGVGYRITYVGSPRTVLAETRRLQNSVGMGTYIRVEYANRGRIVQAAELNDIVNEAEYRAASYRRSLS